MRIAPLLAVVVVPSPLVAEELSATQKADDSAYYGMFLPLSVSPANPATTVRSQGLYDGARDRTALALDGQAQISATFQLRAGATYDGSDLASRAGVGIGLLRDERHGLDLQVAVGWDEAGINEVPAVFGALELGHELGGIYLTGGGRFDLGTEQSERGLSLDLGSLRQIGPALYAGSNARLRFDLERDDTEPMDESTWSLLGGPVVTYVVDRFAVTASGGLAYDKPRMAAREVGAFGLVGVGAAF